MPLAGTTSETGKIQRTGPREICPALFTAASRNLRLLSGTLCTRVVHRNGVATGIVIKDIHTGEETEISAKVVLLAADALRTPQLLWASDIRPAALGVRLNE